MGGCHGNLSVSLQATRPVDQLTRKKTSRKLETGKNFNYSTIIVQCTLCIGHWLDIAVVFNSTGCNTDISLWGQQSNRFIHIFSKHMFSPNTCQCPMLTMNSWPVDSLVQLQFSLVWAVFFVCSRIFDYYTCCDVPVGNTLLHTTRWHRGGIQRGGHWWLYLVPAMCNRLVQDANYIHEKINLYVGACAGTIAGTIAIDCTRI